MKLTPKILIFTFSISIFFCIGFTWQELKVGQLPTKDAFLKLIHPEEFAKKANPIQVFKEHYDKISVSYYQALEKNQLKYAAMSGLLAATGDPYTAYMPPEAAKEFKQETQGNIVGIGALLSRDPLGARVRKVFEDTPAFRSGLKDGDLIVSADEKKLEGKNLEEIVSLVRGLIHTTVRLGIVRQHQKETLFFNIKRDNVTVPTVDCKFFDQSKVGYISVSMFSEPTAVQFNKALLDIDKKNPKGLVIDLRWNPGGLLDIATKMASRFVSNQKVVTMKMRDGRELNEFTQYGRTFNFSYPVAVLINQDSASAAEIFASVLKDYKLATVVGETSYGKASVQVPFPIADGSFAKITIARYYPPSGEDISRKVDEEKHYVSGGVKPDIEVPYEPDANFIFGEPHADPQLQKAIDTLIHKELKPILANQKKDSSKGI